MKLTKRRTAGTPLLQVQLVTMPTDAWTETLRLGEFPQDLSAIVSLYGQGPGVQFRATSAAAAVTAGGPAPGGIRLNVQVAPSMDSALDRKGTLYLDVLVSPGLSEPPPEAIYRWVLEQVLVRGVDRVELHFGAADTIARDLAVELAGTTQGASDEDIPRE